MRGVEYVNCLNGAIELEQRRHVQQIEIEVVRVFHSCGT